MEEELIYHGSNQIVRNPRILVQGFYKDFGYGFYCTRMEKQAMRWANTKRNPHIVNVYAYEGKPGLAVKLFPDMTDEWLDFIAACRTGKEHSYDIVEGPMAEHYLGLCGGFSGRKNLPPRVLGACQVQASDAPDSVQHGGCPENHTIRKEL